MGTTVRVVLGTVIKGEMMLEMLLPSHTEPCEAQFTDYRAGFFPKCHGKPLKKFGP